MGMSSGSGGGTSKHVSSEINVTPLIDVLLVLLIIFLVVMPIMTKMETLHVPRNLHPYIETSDLTQLVVKVKGDLSIHFNDGTTDTDTPIQAVDIARVLRPKVQAIAAGQEKVVFVEFEDAVPWGEVVTTMDTVRSLSGDANHDEVKVALKMREEGRGP